MVLTETIEQTGVFSEGSLTEVVESIEATDESEFWSAAVAGSLSIEWSG